MPTVVSDKSGAHVSGLKKEEFVLKQDGKVKPVAVFEEVRTDATRLRRSRGEQGSYSNFEPGESHHHRLSIIVLDFVNTPFADQSTARTALLKFLTEVAGSGEPMCLLALTRSGLTLIHDFTDDPKLLADALNKARSSAPGIHDAEVDPHHPTDGPLAATITALIRGQMQSEAQLASLEAKASVSITVEALQQIAKAFRGLPGRKSLIWASSGFPFSLSPSSTPSIIYELDTPVHKGDEMQVAYEHLWKMMNDAQIAIYSVDLRSSSAGMTMVNGGVRPSDIGDPQFDTDAQEREKAVDTNTTLQLFAENTGGKAFLGGGNLVQSFRQAVDDDTSYYMLGYYVSPGNTKAGWHAISVDVHAKRVHLRYRKGFSLTRDTSVPSAREDIQLALSSPLDFTGVPISVSWDGPKESKPQGKHRAMFDLVLPPGFASVDETEDNHMVVDIAAIARNARGEMGGEVSQRLDVHLKPANLEQIQHNGMTYHNGIQLAPGDYTVRFVVRDALGNRMGSVAAPVIVAP